MAPFDSKLLIIQGPVHCCLSLPLTFETDAENALKLNKF